MSLITYWFLFGITIRIISIFCGYMWYSHIIADEPEHLHTSSFREVFQLVGIFMVLAEIVSVIVFVWSLGYFISELYKAAMKQFNKLRA